MLKFFGALPIRKIRMWDMFQRILHCKAEDLPKLKRILEEKFKSKEITARPSEVPAAEIRERIMSDKEEY